MYEPGQIQMVYLTLGGKREISQTTEDSRAKWQTGDKRQSYKHIFFRRLVSIAEATPNVRGLYSHWQLKDCIAI